MLTRAYNFLWALLKVRRVQYSVSCKWHMLKYTSMRTSFIMVLRAFLITNKQRTCAEIMHFLAKVGLE